MKPPSFVQWRKQFSWSARVALAKRLRGMVPSPDEFEFVETAGELHKAAEDFVDMTIQLADSLTRGEK